MIDSPVMLITGATGSIGSAIAREALAQGWRVALHGRSADKVEALEQALGDGAQGFVADISAPDVAGTLISAVTDAMGRIDAVIDCVASGPQGVRLTGPFAQTDPQGFGAFYDLSAAWFQRLSHAAYPHLSTNGGTLIGFISDAGRFAAPNQTVIGAARAAEIGFVRNLAVEAARDGIRVHAISPSFVKDSASARAMGSERMAKAEARAGLGLPTPQDIAPLALFLCGDGAVKITGQIISVNGGLNA
jgi:NAD(P)-dependent dehydrogenase (short-subunit alcohol dehydrogenase family)